MKVKIRLDTKTDAIKLASIVQGLEGNITITDNAGLRVHAKSIIGALYAMEFSEIWLESENDIYSYISEFVIL